METQQIWLAAIIAFMASASALGLLYALFGGKLFGYSRFEQRTRSIIEGQSALDADAEEKLKGIVSRQRRKRIQERLKALEQEQRGKSLARSRVRVMLQQSGLGISMRQFVLLSILSGVVFALVFWVLGSPWYALLLIIFAAIFGFPRWLLAFLIRRRRRAFILQFPDALDVMVRGVRAGLPLMDCLHIVAREGQEPVKSEFDTIARSLSVGITLPQALDLLHDRLPLPEVNFFAVVISMQQQTGGNLSEAISNLSNVLRERRRMRQKVVALSQEAKYSAGIIGALPFLIMVMMYVISPGYLLPLFETTLGNIALLVALAWMGVGALVMRTMISFDV